MGILLRILLLLFQGSFAGIVNVVINQKEEGPVKVRTYISSILISIFCGYITYYFTLEYKGISENMRIVIVSISALSGREVLTLLQKLVLAIIRKKINVDTNEGDTKK